MGGSYRIQTKADGLYWHENGLGDKLLSTRFQPNDDYTRFFFEWQPNDDSFRIRVKADGRYLHEDGWGDKLLSTRYQPNDDFTRFYLRRLVDDATLATTAWRDWHLCFWVGSGVAGFFAAVAFAASRAVRRSAVVPQCQETLISANA
eukprot:NODE_5646_length_565_cov_263.027451.p1 GENE.NODE_5646_length_565_cov_263.027451~~NODE_5646_length_565_cov_263.027451.p1  ORF type:complete len:147 (+),score=31.30 NODE_5646_length_565_cov_263.027451:3-443(+)